MAAHGTPSRYNAGCRCDVCTGAKRERAKEQRRDRYRRFAAGEVDVPHGSASTYINWGCRCDPCKAAGSEMNKQYAAGVRVNLTPEQRSERARKAARSVHRRGRTNTAPARRAFLRKFEDEVDPDRILSPEEREERAKRARKAHFDDMAAKSVEVRRERKADAS